MGVAGNASGQNAQARFQNQPQASLARFAQAGKQDLRDPGQPWRDFHVELLTPALHGTIKSPPDDYPIEEALLARVYAGRPGWQLSLKATHLTLQTDQQGPFPKIDPTEICALDRDSNPVPLQNPYRVIEVGKPGVTNVEVHFILDTQTLLRPGIYAGWIFITAQKVGSPQSKMIKVPFEVEVRCQVEHSISGNKIYFHVGNPFKRERLSGIVTGRLSADAPMLLVLTVSSGRIDRMPQQKPFLKDFDDRCGSVWIPVAWKLGESNQLRLPDTKTEDGRSIGWSLKGTPGRIEYKLECEINPGGAQPPGNYGTSATVTLKPLL